jgi:hypothetical protein
MLAKLINLPPLRVNEFPKSIVVVLAIKVPLKLFEFPISIPGASQKTLHPWVPFVKEMPWLFENFSVVELLVKTKTNTEPEEPCPSRTVFPLNVIILDEVKQITPGVKVCEEKDVPELVVVHDWDRMKELAEIASFLAFVNAVFPEFVEPLIEQVLVHEILPEAPTSPEMVAELDEKAPEPIKTE